MRKVASILAYASGEPVTLSQYATIAKDFESFDSMTFDLVGPTGKVPCKWLDAYYGFFQIIGKVGFLSADQFEFVNDIKCENLNIDQPIPQVEE